MVQAKSVGLADSSSLSFARLRPAVEIDTERPEATQAKSVGTAEALWLHAQQLHTAAVAGLVEVRFSAVPDTARLQQNLLETAGPE